MKSTISKVITFLVLIHLLNCLAIIFFPQSLRSTIVYSVYAKYLLPGPFFSENAIGDTYQLSVMWKDENNSWSEPVNPALNNYRRSTSGNISLLNRGRTDRALYQQLVIKDSSGSKFMIDEKKLGFLKQYYKAHYIHEYADSIRLVITHKDTRDFYIKKDTLKIIQY